MTAVADRVLFTSDEVRAATGITHRQLDYWTRTGVVAPGARRGAHGVWYGWTADDIAALRLVAAVRNHARSFPIHWPTLRLEVATARILGHRWAVWHHGRWDTTDNPRLAAQWATSAVSITVNLNP